MAGRRNDQAAKEWLRVGARLPSAVGTTSNETISHETIQLKGIPPRGQVHASLGTRDLILNTERFHKRDQHKHEQHSTPCSKGLEHDPPDGLGCRMKCPKNAVGNPWVGMGPSCRSANRITGDLAADRMQPNVKQELWPEGRYCCHLDELDASRACTKVCESIRPRFDF